MGKWLLEVTITFDKVADENLTCKISRLPIINEKKYEKKSGIQIYSQQAGGEKKIYCKPNPRIKRPLQRKL